jgi:undecaprenyl diphosphate synthase
MKKIKIPYHVAIILDGNGRWATAKGLNRSEGHKAGYENLKKLSKYIFSEGVKILSIYAFSTENFARDKKEVDYLMNTFIRAFDLEKKYFHKENIKIIFSGRNEPLPEKVIETRNNIAEYTKNNTKGILNICLNYGGRAEIVDACKKIIEDNISSAELDEGLFSKYLYQDLPDVDLMIRTSGELRLSNFLLWQNSYAEFYFSPVPFPDFDAEEFDKALVEYTKRDRRFGKINSDK